MIRFVRLAHLYSGLFFAPAIIFFALTGALQTVTLHDSKPNEGYVSPQWVQKLVAVHKRQTLMLVVKKSAPTERQPAGPDTAASVGRAVEEGLHPNLPMKLFTLLLALSLTASSVQGVYMAFKYRRDRKMVWGLLVAGTLVPVLLLVR